MIFNSYSFRNISSLLMLLILLSVPSIVHAHRVSVFAYIEGDKVYTESYFSKKKRVHQGEIQVLKLIDDELILKGITDDNGDFVFSIPDSIKSQPSGLKIVLVASEGHRGEWILTADEIFPESQTSPPAQQNNIAQIKSDSPDSSVNVSELPELKKQISMLNTKLETIKRMLIDQQEKSPGIHEILSGIGYIFGLFGVAAFVASRKK